MDRATRRQRQRSAMCTQVLSESVDAALQQVFLVGVVRVERGAPDVGSLGDLGNTRGFEALLEHQLDQRPLERFLTSANAAIGGGHGVLVFLDSDGVGVQ